MREHVTLTSRSGGLELFEEKSLGLIRRGEDNAGVESGWEVLDEVRCGERYYLGGWLRYPLTGVGVPTAC